MNVVFGVAPVDEARLDDGGPVGRACQRLQEPHVQLSDNGSGSVIMGSLGADEIIGWHCEGAVRLACIGTITRSSPGWKSDSAPIDSLAVTAKYLLERYRSLGRRFLDGVFGAYVVAVHDQAEDVLLVASDPGGGRVVFVYQNQHRLAFSTHLLTLTALLGKRASVDRTYEDFFLVHGFYPFNGTPVNGVRYLAAGQILEWRKGAVTAYKILGGDPWAVQNSQIDFDSLTEKAAVALLHDALIRATSDQTANSKDAAVLLGGFDSALIASILTRLGKKVETYSFRYGEQRYNQPHVEQLAKYLGIRHHWVDIEPNVIADGIDNYARKFSFATNWLNYPVQTEFVCRQIRRQGHRYCYSGDGCDAIFLGYPRTHFVSKYLDSVSRIPSPIVRALLAVLDWGALERTIGRPHRVLLGLLRSSARRRPQKAFLTFQLFDPTSLKRLRRDTPPPQQQSNEEILERLTAGLENMSRDRIAYMGKASISPNKAKLLGSSDSSGLAISSPYLHAGLKQFATRLPDRLSRPGEKTASYVTGKYILMKVAETAGLLPTEIIYQKKMSAVDAPMDEWYFGPLAAQVRNRLQDLPFEPNPRFINSLLTPKWAENFYRSMISTDNLTTHELSLLICYSRLTAFARS